MKNQLTDLVKNQYYAWLHDQQYYYGGLLAFLAALQDWWGFRPRIVKCEGCNSNIWHNGFPQAPIYCDQYCYYYGPQESSRNDSEEIPF